MSPEDWTLIKHTFTAALNLPEGERAAFVAAACEQRPELIASVQELLQAHGEASQSFLAPEGIMRAARWLFQEDDCVAGRFKVVRRIARGAMGEVYQVFDERLRVQIALKALRPELIEDRETVERFRREVYVTRDIAHAGLCRVFDLVEHEVTSHPVLPARTIVPCLTMQLLEGETLEDWLVGRRPLTADAALPLIEQMGEALQVLHDAGMVHRDLKPSNVMLVPGGDGLRAVLTDFGLARPLDEAVFETQARVQGGAPFFMAPELLRGQRPSVASDLYAFGLVIDEMVTTTRAFTASSLHALLLQKLKGVPEPPARRGSTIPRQWEQTLQRCIAQDPRDRYRTTQELLAALRVRGGWRRWRGAVRSLQITYFPRRWRLVGYSVAGALALSGAVALGAPVRTDEPIAVTIARFTNLSSNRELNYLAAGTTSELGRRLNAVPNLHVYSAPDSDTPLDPSLKPAYALSGQVQEVAGKLRISVAITEGTQGRLLWSQNFDGKIEQSLALEDQLASATVGELTRRHQLDLGVVRRAWSMFDWRRRPQQLPSTLTVSSAAFEAYLRGKTLFEDRTLESLLDGERFLKAAVREDPNFAAAYAALADVQAGLMDQHYAPHDQLIASAEHYIDQAVALDPNLPEAQLSLGLVRQMQWRWSESEAAYHRAIELNPKSARARRWYGGLLLQFGRFDEALQLHVKAIELDPYDFPTLSAYGHALFQAGRAEEAAAHLEHVLERKDFLNAHALLGQVYAYLGGVGRSARQAAFEQALNQSLVMRTREPQVRAVKDGPIVTSPYADLIAALAWGYQGDAAAAQPFIDRLEAGLTVGGVSPAFLARAYAAQGDTRQAIAWLRRAEAERDREVYYLNVSPFYSGIRGEPQFRALVDRIHLSR